MLFRSLAQRSPLMLLLGTTCLSWSGQALAESTPSAAAPIVVADSDLTAHHRTGNGGGVEEVVVTARHRKEKAQTVPIALTTIPGKQLSDNGVVSVTQLGAFAPSLQVTETNPRNTSFNIRGIGNNVSVTSDGLESGVGVYVDGVLFGRPGTATFAFPDLDSVQVLRGPQGTLFGKNTTSGAIDVHTLLPSFTFGASGEASVGNYGWWQVKGTVSGPVNDAIAVRVSFIDDTRNGYITNINTGQHFENLDDKSVRTQLLYKPNADLTVRVILDYAHEKEACCVPLVTGVVSTLVTGAPFPNGIGVRGAQFGYVLPPINAFDYKTDINTRTRFQMETGGASAQADYNLNGVTLTSITGWRFWNWDPFNDGDATAIDAIDDTSQTNNQKQFSQELRATSASGQRIEWTGGLYYFYQALPGQARTAYGTEAGPYLLSPKTPPSLANVYVDNLTVAANTQAITASYAGYGQATWHVLPKLDLTGGLRYTYEDKDGSYDQFQYGAESLDGLTPAQQASAIAVRNSLGKPLYYDDHSHSGSLSWLMTATYKPTPDAIFYATYSRGNKSGGINITNLPPGINAVVKPERTDNYEVGFKSQLFNNRLVFNAAAYWIEDSDYQATVSAPLANGTFTQYFASVPKVRSRGVELDLTTARFFGFQGRFSGSFDDAIYESFPAGVCPVELTAAATKICNLTGESVPGTSRWNASIGGDYQHFIGQYGPYGLIAYLGADLSLKSSFNDSVNNSIYAEIPGYGVLDLRGGIRTDDGRYDFFLWSHNATDSKYYQTLGASGANGIISGIVGDPVTYGATARVHF